MGIDIYMEWPKQTEAEKKAQITGFSATHGHKGYLREAYHGGPYVTKFLVKEAFEAENAEAQIPAKVLRERLPAAVMLATYRNHVVYEEPDPAFDNIHDALTAVFAETKRTDNEGAEIAAKMVGEQLRAAEELIKQRKLPDYCLSYVDFVELAEKVEAKLGQPVTIIASY